MSLILYIPCAEDKYEIIKSRRESHRAKIYGISGSCTGNVCEHLFVIPLLMRMTMHYIESTDAVSMVRTGKKSISRQRRIYL